MIGATKVGLTLERAPWTRLSWRKDTYSAASAPSSKPPMSFLLAPRLSCGTRWYGGTIGASGGSEEHTSELQSPCNLVCRLLLEKKKKKNNTLRLSAVVTDIW